MRCILRRTCSVTPIDFYRRHPHERSCGHLTDRRPHFICRRTRTAHIHSARTSNLPVVTLAALPSSRNALCTSRDRDPGRVLSEDRREDKIARRVKTSAFARRCHVKYLSRQIWPDMHFSTSPGPARQSDSVHSGTDQHATDRHSIVHTHSPELRVIIPTLKGCA